MAFPSHAEGHPLVVLEALSASVPVIATRVGAIPEMLADGIEGYLVAVGDVSALADRIAALVSDPAMRARMSVAARMRYEAEFTAHRFATRLGRVWQDVLEKHVSTPRWTSSRDTVAT